MIGKREPVHPPKKASNFKKGSIIGLVGVTIGVGLTLYALRNNPKWKQEYSTIKEKVSEYTPDNPKWKQEYSTLKVKYSEKFQSFSPWSPKNDEE